MSGRPTITAALIVRDEQQNLTELLPLLDWVDEVLVVDGGPDGGSADATTEVAQAHGCRIVSRIFDTFADQRNHALKLATGDWILSIDADERPTRSLVLEIRRQIARERYNAFRIPIRSTIFGRPMRRGGIQDDRPIRLFRRGQARWVRGVHEVLDVEGRVGTLHSWLTHDTLPDLESFLVKMHRYTRLEARARVAAEEPPRANDVWFRPCREVFRRLIYKQGFLDGPTGWAFCLLSGLSEWNLACEHRRCWTAAASKLRAPLRHTPANESQNNSRSKSYPTRITANK